MANDTTLLLATHDGAVHLREQLDSLRSQTRTTWRLAVLDDGSSDRTVDILAEYSALDERISFRTRPVAAGATPSYLTLLDELDTPFFGFVDQDDVWRPDRLERVTAALAAAEPDRPTLVFTDSTVVDECRELIAVSSIARYGYRSARDVALPRLLVQNGASGNTMLGNRALARLATTITVDRSELFAHDWWCAVLAATAGELIGLDEPTLEWRQHGSNTTGATRRWYDKAGLTQVRQLRRRARALLEPAAAQAVQLHRLVGSSLSPADDQAVQALAALHTNGVSRRQVLACWRLGVRLSPLPRQLALVAGAS